MEEYEATCNDKGKEFTSKGAIRFSREKGNGKSKPILTLPKNTYTVLYADPPWKYTEAGLTGVSNKDEYGNVDKHYQQMSIKELCEMKLPKIAANAVLSIWVTSPFLKKVFSIISAWGELPTEKSGLGLFLKTR